MSLDFAGSDMYRKLQRSPWSLPLFVLFSCWLLACLPVIIYSQLFPLDVGTIFDFGENFDKWLPWMLSPHNGSGRYFPVYWLYYTIPFPLFGMYAWPYLLMQSLLFALALGVGAKIVYRATCSTYLAASSIALSFLSSATPENISTVGKAEILAYLFCILALSTYLARPNSVPRSALISILFCLAIWTKETSLALFAIPVGGGIIITLLLYSRWLEERPRLSYGRLLAALLVGWALSRLPYYIWSEGANAAKSYTSYPINAQLVLDNLIFYVTQQPDLFVFALASTFLLLFLAWRTLSKGSQIDEYHIFFIALCGAGWGYIVVLLVWRWPMAYYMLMPALFFRLAFVYSIFALGRHARLRKATVLLGIVASLYVVPYGYYVIQSQISYSRIYTDALKEYVRQPETGGLIIENYPFFGEHVGGTAMLLRLMGDTRTVKGIGDVLDPTPYPEELLKMLKIDQDDLANNVKNIPREGDYVLTFTGDKLATWFLRGVTPFYQPDTHLTLQAPYKLELVAQEDIRAPAVYINTWTWWPEARITSLGYKLFRVLEDQPPFLWLGHFLDGWIGKNSSLQINKDFKGPIHLKASAPDFLLPNNLKIIKDGSTIKTVEFTSTDEIELILPVDGERTSLFEFEVERVVSPASIGMSRDRRQLGIRLDLVQDFH